MSRLFFLLYCPHELALGLEMMGQQFLWVVWPDLTDAAHIAFSEGFEERVAEKGRIAGWLPQ
ncbi:hypothetical protein QJS10_CPA06g02333 [Acorus calamus]|uniref:Uncharacterized protein n=1 Tax=Acorus calamus TaxID=4465 RepID=A0AAV9EN27_ACOCL|nr:hypothetical protein QJS10_CPA06g02333 [Acorus calamus]